jgi:hypothetical protein
VLTALDRTFRRPADVPFLLDLPVLAVVPYSPVFKPSGRKKKSEPPYERKTPSQVRAS